MMPVDPGGGSGAGGGAPTTPNPAPAPTPAPNPVPAPAPPSPPPAPTPPAGAVAACPPPKPPCAGLGMGDQAAIDKYAEAMAKLRKDWKSLTKEQRKARMQEIVNQSAKDAGFPPPEVQLKPLGKDLSGQLSFETWDIDINQDLAAKDDISDDEFTELADTIYHETRHGEQWYLIARRDAAEGMKAKEIGKKRGIEDEDVTKAAEKDPLRKGEPKRKCADAMFNSVYGTGRAHRNKVLTDLEKDGEALDKARKAVKDARKDKKTVDDNPASTPAQKKAAQDKLDDAIKKRDAAQKKNDETYEKYRNLPEEADGWDAGTRAGEAVKKAITPKPAPPPPPGAPLPPNLP